MHIKNIEQELNNKSVTKALYLALGITSILMMLKISVASITQSFALKASAIDSFVDVVLAIINLIVLQFTNKKASSKFPFGHDKIVSLVTIFHSILILFLISNLLYDCVDKIFNPTTITAIKEGVIVLSISILLNIILVTYQNKVVKKTNSMLIKSDLMHFKTDLLINLSILIGFIAIWLFNITWVDPFVGIAAGVYLLFGVYNILKTALFSILDVNDSHCLPKIKKTLKDNKIHIQDENIFILFSGKTHRLFIKTQDTNQILPMKEIISKNHNEFELFIITNN